MAQPFKEPTFQEKAFNCPHCHAYAQQFWTDLNEVTNRGYQTTPFSLSKCGHCGGKLYWHNDKIVVPDVSSAPPANDDLDDEIKSDYAEAAAIVMKSPRGAAALLRLCVQKLCKQLGEKGKNIDDDIGSLVKKGLDARIQMSLDTVRVVGNEAVHPGEMDLKDDTETAGMLFALLNAIADQMITQPKLRDNLYAKLPKAKRDGIAKRDAKE